MEKRGQEAINATYLTRNMPMYVNIPTLMISKYAITITCTHLLPSRYHYKLLVLFALQCLLNFQNESAWVE